MCVCIYTLAYVCLLVCAPACKHMFIITAICFQLCLAHGEDQRSVRKLTEEWFGDLLRACDEYLSSVILSDDPGMFCFQNIVQKNHGPYLKSCYVHNAFSIIIIYNVYIVPYIMCKEISMR